MFSEPQVKALTSKLSAKYVRTRQHSVLRKGFETIDCGFHAANAAGCCCSALTCAGVI